MDSMGCMHTNCEYYKNVDHLPSTDDEVTTCTGTKIGVWCHKLAIKPNFWPNFMGFKVGFHGFSWVLWVLCIQTVNQVVT